MTSRSDSSDSRTLDSYVKGGEFEPYSRLIDSADPLWVGKMSTLTDDGDRWNMYIINRFTALTGIPRYGSPCVVYSPGS